MTFIITPAPGYLRPYEDLIMDGEVLEPTGGNDQMFYSESDRISRCSC